MQTTQERNVVKTALQQIRDGKQMMQEGEQAIRKLNLDGAAIIAYLTDTDVEVPERTAPTASNVDRSPAGRTFRMIGDRPSLPWAIRTLLKDEPLTFDALVEKLQAKNWISKDAKHPRAHVQQALNAQKHIFLASGRGGDAKYSLAENVQVPPIPSSGTVAHKPAKRMASKAKTVSTAATPSKVLPKVIDLLRHTRKEFSIKDIVRATKLDAKSVQGVALSLIRTNAIEKTREKKGTEPALFKINRDKFNKYTSASN